MILANQKCNPLGNSKIPNFERINSVGTRTLGPHLFERSALNEFNRAALSRAAEIFFRNFTVVRRALCPGSDPMEIRLSGEPLVLPVTTPLD